MKVPFRLEPAWVATALTPWLAPLAMAQGVERVATPQTGAPARQDLAIAVNELAERTECLVDMLDHHTQACPSPCMIPVSTVEATSVDMCELSQAARWQCRWPRQWVRESTSCNGLGFGGGWTGQATVEQEYEIQSCGSVIVPTGATRRILDTSSCRRTLTQNGSMACPTNGASLPAGTPLDPTFANSWQTQVSRGVGWSGSGITLTRTLTQGLDPSGNLQDLGTSVWSPTSASCQRAVDRLVASECNIGQYTAYGYHSGPLQTCENTYPGYTIHHSGSPAMYTWQAGYYYHLYQFWQVHGGPYVRGCAIDLHPNNHQLNVSLSRDVYTLRVSSQGTYETLDQTQTSELQRRCEAFSEQHSWGPCPDNPFQSCPPSGGSSNSNENSEFSRGIDGRDDGHTGGGSGGNNGGDASVLCGFYYSRGELSRCTYIADLRYGQAHISAVTLRGYHVWAVPLVRYLEAHPRSLLVALLRPVVRGWAQEMAYRMHAARRGSRLGRMLLHTAAPLCTALGWLVPAAPPLSLAMARVRASVAA